MDHQQTAVLQEVMEVEEEHQIELELGEEHRIELEELVECVEELEELVVLVELEVLVVEGEGVKLADVLGVEEGCLLEVGEQKRADLAGRFAGQYPYAVV